MSRSYPFDFVRKALFAQGERFIFLQSNKNQSVHPAVSRRSLWRSRKPVEGSPRTLYIKSGFESVRPERNVVKSNGYERYLRIKPILFSLLTYLSFASLQAHISFSDRNGSVRLNHGATLIVDTAINNWNGTLEKKDGSLVDGDIIIFQNGILQSGGTEALLNAYYQGGGLETLYLSGSSRIRAEPGLLIPAVQVSGNNNSLEGQPRFEGDVWFDGQPTTVLTLGLQSVMNKNINLYNGTIILNDDLHFADDANFQGRGVVDLNFKALHFSPYDFVATHTLTFYNATDINLHSRINLSSTYVFDGKTFFNGHGNVLDLSTGGCIIVAPQSEVYLSDVYLRGFGLGGKIIFSDNTSSLHLSNVHIELDDNMQMTIGNISVDGDSVFILKHWNWTFDTYATLTVDGATLWLDIDNPQSNNVPGLLNIPNPLYMDHVWNLTNEAQGRRLGNFSLVQSGTVKELGWAWSQTSTDLGCTLIRGPIFADVTMQRNCDVPPVKTIDIRESMTLDGQGAWISFSNSGSPEFIVAPGKTVRLKNVNLLRVTGTTFSLGQGASLEIDKGVVFELAEDVSLTGDFIKILGTEVDPNVFILRGVGSQKRVTIDPIYQSTPAGDVIVKTFDIGLATVIFENIEFSGLQSVSASRVEFPDGGVFVGSFGLFDNATVNIDIDSEMSFYAEGSTSLLRFLYSGLTMSGFMLFSSQFEATVHMKFGLPQKLDTPPELYLADNAINLSSEQGLARLIFDDYAVALNMLGSNSFVTDVHSFIGGQNLIVYQYPIKQMSIDLVLDEVLRLSSDQPNAIDTSFVRSFGKAGGPQRVHMAITDLGLQKQRLLDDKRIIKQAHTHAKIHSMPLERKVLTSKQKKKKASKAKIEKSKVLTKAKNTTMTRGSSIEGLTRLGPSGETPEPYRVYQASQTGTNLEGDAGGNKQQDLNLASGIVGVLNGTITKFGIDPNVSLNLWMRGNATLLPATDVIWKSADKLYVTGSNNTIRVTNTMIFDGNIIFDLGARLTFDFDENADNPTVIFNSSTYKTLFLSSLVQLEFKGKGTVQFADGKSITFVGTTIDERATVILSDQVTMRLGSGTAGIATVTISGIGDVLIEEGAILMVKRGQHLIVGDATTDIIDFTVNRSGVVDLGDALEDGVNSTNNNPARLSFTKATYNISFTQGGILNIGKGGEFAINAKRGVAYNKAQAGLLEQLNFGDGGWCWLDYDGRFIIGQNIAIKGIIPQITFNSKYGTMQGDGVVELAGTSLIARPCFWTPSRILVDAQHLVRLFVNRKKQLTFSTFFVGADGKARLFNKDVDLYSLGFPTPSTTIITLFPDDEIRNDDKTTGQVYGVNNGQMFSILPDGSRL